MILVGFAAGLPWLAKAGSIGSLLLSGSVLWRSVQPRLNQWLSPSQWTFAVAVVGLMLALLGLLELSALSNLFQAWANRLDWERFGTLGGLLGALGQILIALLALYVTWEQYVISKDLTIRSNTITQQQTIDAYFQGIAELMLTDGMLEDFPMERAIAEGRTAALLGSLDASGKAKVLRFLSRSGLLTPLRRDGILGRAILNGEGEYAEDRPKGVRVIDLGVMLAGANLSQTDLRWADLSDINLFRANLSSCDLVKANLSRTIASEASFAGADLMSVRFFYGKCDRATPRSRAQFPDYASGACTGTVVEDADFTNVRRLSDEQRYYCCAWSGSRSRKTIPGGCDGIPNRLGR